MQTGDLGSPWYWTNFGCLNRDVTYGVGNGSAWASASAADLTVNIVPGASVIVYPLEIVWSLLNSMISYSNSFR